MKSFLKGNKSINYPNNNTFSSWMSNEKSTLYKCFQNDKDSIKNLKEKVSKNSDNLEDLKNYADCLSVRGKFSKAFYFYDRSLALSKRKNIKSSIFNNLGVMFSKRGIFSYSDFYYNKALKMDNTNTTALFNYTKILMKRGKYLESAKLIKKYRLFQTNKVYWSSLEGLNYFLQGSTDQKLINLLAQLNDKSDKILFLEIASTYKNDPKRSELIQRLNELSFNETLWESAKNELIFRIRKVLKDEKNRGYLSTK